MNNYLFEKQLNRLMGVPEDVFTFATHAGPTGTTYIVDIAICYQTCPCQHYLIKKQGDHTTVTLMTRKQISDIFKKHNVTHPHFS